MWRVSGDGARAREGALGKTSEEETESERCSVRKVAIEDTFVLYCACCIVQYVRRHTHAHSAV